MAHLNNKQGMAVGMMKEMMGPGKIGPGMMSPEMMKNMMGSGMGRETANVIVVTAGTGSSHGFLARLIRNPAVLIGLGIATGYLIHKYRKEIVSDTPKTD